MKDADLLPTAPLDDLHRRLYEGDEGWQPVFKRQNAEARRLRRQILGGILASTGGEAIVYLESKGPGRQANGDAIGIVAFTASRCIKLCGTASTAGVVSHGQVEDLTVYSRRPLLGLKIEVPDDEQDLREGEDVSLDLQAVGLCLNYPWGTLELGTPSAHNRGREGAAERAAAFLPSLLDDLGGSLRGNQG